MYADGNPKQMVSEPEPKVSDVAGTAKDIELKVFATADNARYTCGAPPEGILFKPTMMYQTRIFTFPLVNDSTSQLNFKFTVFDVDGYSIDSSGLYSISPEGGTIPASGSVPITVRFAPKEVVDCARVLAADIQGLDPNAKPLHIPLDGRVVRPWCHFELADSDYITAGRRDAGERSSLPYLTQ
jgi:hydrocephalus-inducing protein